MKTKHGKEIQMLNNKTNVTYIDRMTTREIVHDNKYELKAERKNNINRMRKWE